MFHCLFKFNKEDYKNTIQTLIACVGPAFCLNSIMLKKVQFVIFCHFHFVLPKELIKVKWVT